MELFCCFSLWELGNVLYILHLDFILYEVANLNCAEVLFTYYSISMCRGNRILGSFNNNDSVGAYHINMGLIVQLQ